MKFSLHRSWLFPDTIFIHVYTKKIDSHTEIYGDKSGMITKETFLLRSRLQWYDQVNNVEMYCYRHYDKIEKALKKFLVKEML